MKNFYWSIFLKNFSWSIESSLVAQRVKLLLAMRETRVQSLGWEDPLEKGMATHSGILAWRTAWVEEPGGYSPRGRRESDTPERLHFDFTLSCARFYGAHTDQLRACASNGTRCAHAPVPLFRIPSHLGPHGALSRLLALYRWFSLGSILFIFSIVCVCQS